MNANRIENHILLSDVSDHFATLTKIKGIGISHKHEKIYRRNTNLSEQEQKKFNDEIDKILSEKIVFGNDSDPNKIADEIVKIFHYVIDKYMPLKKLTRKQTRFYHKPWITPALKVSIAKKNNLFDIAKKTKDPQKFEEYKKFRNLLTRTKFIAEDSYYREKMIEYGQDKAKTWRLINEISKRKRKNKTSIACLKGNNGKTLHDKREISNCLNSHFSSIGKNMAKEIDDLNLPDLKDPLEYISHKLSSLVTLSETDIPEIVKLISDLNKKKGNFDQISNKVIKSSCSVIAPFLVNLFNLCLKTGIFPECFKTAKVKPLFKGGDRQDPISYRPISLLPSLGKILEKVISIRLLHYFNDFDLFSQYQFGFREGFTTEFAILDIYEKILNNLDNGQTTCSIFLDLAKAFDSVSHEILLRKLEKYGIQGKVLELFTSYLAERKQFVEIDNVQSLIKIIEFGVPQGSILGPILFLIYINDLPEATTFFIKLYADDTYLCAKNDDLYLLENEVNVELDKVNKWLASNKLTLNIDKSKFMITCRQKCTNPFF